MTDLRSDHGPNPDGKSHRDHRNRERAAVWGPWYLQLTL